MSNFWIISDTVETAYEMLSKARELVKDSSITAFINGSESEGQEAIGYGADAVKLMAMPGETTWESYVPMLMAEAQAQKPELILVGATRRGKDLAAQLSALLDCPCVTECKSIQYDAGKFLLKRIVYGGLAEKTIECQEFPVVATISGRTFTKWDEKDSTRQGEVSELPLNVDTKVKVLERRPKPSEAVNIKDSQVVIGVGRGFAAQSDLKLAEDLAQAMDGVVACTRPIAEDLHWLPEDRYIGISGQVIKPNIYLTAGISGQVQHVYGIKDSKTIVAVDKNENAPIFQVADYYIVGDLKEVLPALTEAVKAAQGS